MANLSLMLTEERKIDEMIFTNNQKIEEIESPTLYQKKRLKKILYTMECNNFQRQSVEFYINQKYLNKEEICKMLEINLSTLNRWLREEIDFKEENLKKIRQLISNIIPF